jgi:hypothetical protein
VGSSKRGEAIPRAALPCIAARAACASSGLRCSARTLQPRAAKRCATSLPMPPVAPSLRNIGAMRAASIPLMLGAKTSIQPTVSVAALFLARGMCLSRNDGTTLGNSACVFASGLDVGEWITPTATISATQRSRKPLPGPSICEAVAVCSACSVVTSKLHELRLVEEQIMPELRAIGCSGTAALGKNRIVLPSARIGRLS